MRLLDLVAGVFRHKRRGHMVLMKAGTGMKEEPPQEEPPQTGAP